MKTSIEIWIAILLAYIAWQNYRISRSSFRITKDKLRLDLYEKRIKTFEACQKLFSYIAREGKVTNEELNNFLRTTAEYEFLFGDDVKTYINEIQTKGLKVIQLNRRLTSDRLPLGEERTKYAYELSNLEQWFINQFKQSQGIFKKYLEFTIDSDPRVY